MTELPPNSFHPKSRAGWRSWLTKNHAQSKGVWLIRFKKRVGKQYLDYAGAVEEALCFGWIDSKALTIDANRSMMWFAPRRNRSGWSGVNKERIDRMVAEGKMTPAGLEKIELAKRSGTWNALDKSEALEVPPDLARALKANKKAAEYFDAFPPSAKRAILQWVLTAKRPETRSKRIEETVRLAAENKRANQPR